MKSTGLVSGRFCLLGLNKLLIHGFNSAIEGTVPNQLVSLDACLERLSKRVN